MSGVKPHGMTDEAEKQGPGRPRDKEKRAAILDAARDLFYANGVGAVAIETVAAQAEVSKVTIYNQFGDKIKLFQEVVRREADRLAGEFSALDAKSTSFEGRLNAIGTHLMTFLMQEKTAAFDRLLSLEAARHPELAQRYFDHGPGMMRNWLAGIIAEADHRGEIKVEDATTAAEDLAMLWQGFLPLEARLSLRRISRADIEKRVQHGTRLFLRSANPMYSASCTKN